MQAANDVLRTILKGSMAFGEGVGGWGGNLPQTEDTQLRFWFEFVWKGMRENNKNKKKSRPSRDVRVEINIVQLAEEIS